MRALRLFAWCLTAALAAAGSARAQTPARPAAPPDAIDRLAGATVTAIHFNTEGRRTDQPELFTLLEVRAGAPLDLAAVRASLIQLYSAGRFEDVSVRGVSGAGGVELVFDLVPHHVIDRLEFRGTTGLAPDALDREVRQRFNGLPQISQADAAARAVERVLVESGYRDAKASAVSEATHTPDRATLVITVTAGPQTIVASAVVDGHSPLDAKDVLAKAGVKVGEPYRTRQIDQGLDDVIADLRTRGYYEATASHAQDVVSEDGRRADVRVTVDAGRVVTLKFAGDPVAGNLNDLVPVKREGSADRDLLEDSVRRIEAALRREGYWRAAATVARDDSTPGASVITFTVTRGPRFRFDHLEVSGNAAIPLDTVRALIGLEPDAPFDESKVLNGINALRAMYLQRGYAAATIVPATTELPADKPGGDPRVVEHLAIAEGVLTQVSNVVVNGATKLSASQITAAMKLKPGAPYVAAFVLNDRDAIRDRYDLLGYSASIEVKAQLNDDKTRATVTVNVLNEGPQVILDRVIIVGNHRVSEETIRSAVGLKSGQPIGQAERSAVQQRLAALGFFRRIAITEAPHQSGESGTDLVITVDESPTITWGYGGGVEAGLRARTAADGGTVDKFEVAPRASFEAGRTNLGGKNRSVNLFSGISLRPIDDPGNSQRDGKCCGFSEYRLIGSLTEPTVFGTKANALLSLSAEQAIRNSFNFSRRDGSVQVLRRLTEHASVIGRYSIGRVVLSNVRIAPADQLLVDRLFEHLRLSVFSATVLRDTRNDPTAPSSGHLLSADADLAGRAMGSEVGFTKLFLQSFAYHRLPSAPRLVVAGAARVGLARAFVRTVDKIDPSTGQPQADPVTGAVITQRVEDVPASQRFFSGGSTTVRGFQLDRLGTPDLLDANGLSNGGNGLVVFNGELRATLTKTIGAAVFLDSGNVFKRVSSIGFSELRSAAGFGVRYKSPIGPLRADIGWKLGNLFPTDRRRWEFHLSIGEAF